MRALSHPKRICHHLEGRHDHQLQLNALTKLLEIMTKHFGSKVVHADCERFRNSCLISTVGNAMDFDIPEHAFALSQLRKLIDEAAFALDDTQEIFQLIKETEVKTIVYLMDNAGEIVFDRLLVGEIVALAAGSSWPKETSMPNDATVVDARESA